MPYSTFQGEILGQVTPLSPTQGLSVHQAVHDEADSDDNSNRDDEDKQTLYQANGKTSSEDANDDDETEFQTSRHIY
jgi:hypothetical protein